MTRGRPAGFDPTAGMVEMAVRELGAERVLFGSDAGGRSFASQLAKVQGADVPESVRRLILRDNLRRLLTPILRTWTDPCDTLRALRLFSAVGNLAQPLKRREGSSVIMS